MMKLSRLLTFLALFFLLFSIALADITGDISDEEGGYSDAEDFDTGNGSDADESDIEDEDEMDEEFLEELESHSNVLVSPYLLKFSNLEFPLEEDIDLLMSFSNNDEGAFNVSSITGSLHYPFDHRYMVQNFTELKFEEAVRVEGESISTFFYTFQADQTIDTRDFDLVLSIYYEDEEDNLYVTTFFNETVSLIESLDRMDLRSFFMYCAALAAALLAVLFIYKIYTSFKHKRIQENEVENDMDEWLPDSVKLRESKKKGKGSKKKKE